MKNKKKKLISLLLALSCLFVVVLVTLAAADNAEFYSPTARNFITTDGVHITLKEVFDGTEIEVPGEASETASTNPSSKSASAKALSKESAPVAVMPGQEVEKVVWVENLGAQAWVRIKILKRITLATGEAVTDVDGVMQLGEISANDWAEMDGWYYCRAALDKNERTPYLFTSVKFSEEMDNTFQGSTAEILIVAQAVQTAHNGGPNGVATRAAGWPEDDPFGDVDPVDPGTGGNEP